MDALNGPTWAVALRPLPGEVACGDAWRVRTFGEALLVVVVDGLGHGEQAETAARVALATLEDAGDGSLPELFTLCHRALATTRGVAMTIARIERGRLEWAGVGNIAVVLIPAASDAPRRHPLLVGGVVGYRCPPLLVRSVDVQPGDLLMLVTDGIDPDWLPGPRSPFPTDGALDTLVSAVLHRWALPGDDALVLAVRPVG